MSKENLFGTFLRRALLCWLLAVTVEYGLLDPALRDLSGLEGLSRMEPGRMGGVFAAGFGLLTVLGRFGANGQWERWAMAGIFTLLAGLGLHASFTWPFLGACVLVLGILLVYGWRGWNVKPVPRRKLQPVRRGWLWATGLFTGLFFLLVSLWGLGRIWSFSTPTYDFGIFAQMFYNLKESGLPLTTVERDGLLSHFAVHVSPIYYLLLPIYLLVPMPETLPVLQAAVMASAVVPLWLLGRTHGLTGGQRTLLCGVLLLYPAFAGGAGYDIHENCFLTPLLLWLLWAIDRKHLPGIVLAAVLTMMVKEDAPVYVAVVGLWLLVQSGLRRKWRETAVGAALLVGALAWFAGATAYLSGAGDGVMTYRYDNFMFVGSGSLMTVIRAVLRNPMKAVFECVDPEKLGYLALTLGPVLGLPLLTRRYENYLLLIPYVLVNLMSDYRYQHDLFFQYNFGSAAFLLYLTAVHLGAWKQDWNRTAALVGMAAVCAGCFIRLILPTAVSYPCRVVQYAEYYQQLRQELAQIPEDAAVTASTFYTTALSQRETLYDLRYCSRAHLLESEYVAVQISSPGCYETYGDMEDLTALLEAEGYTVWKQWEGELVIFRRGT